MEKWLQFIYPITHLFSFVVHYGQNARVRFMQCNHGFSAGHLYCYKSRFTEELLPVRSQFNQMMTFSLCTPHSAYIGENMRNCPCTAALLPFMICLCVCMCVVFVNTFFRSMILKTLCTQIATHSCHNI